MPAATKTGATTRTDHHHHREHQQQHHSNLDTSCLHTPLQYHFTRRAAIVEKREHMFVRAMSKAMRYYRVWIYSCNVALFLGTLLYSVAFVTVIGDSTLNFFPAIRLYQPSFIYSYFAIVVQGGLLQTIGCLGALKLNERYLNTYLIAIFALLFGDGILGIVWILRYNDIVTNLRSDLRLQIAKNYAVDPQLEDLWNELQSSFRCCGVDGPNDYGTSAWLNITIGSARTAAAAAAEAVDDRETESGERDHFAPMLPLGGGGGGAHPEWTLPRSCCLAESVPPSHRACRGRVDEDHVFKKGCYEHLYHWLQSSADLLSVLGFCVITFVKMCFLCLLRYEIKEMIEKIKVIKGQTAASNVAANMMPFQDLEAYLPRPSMQHDTLLALNQSGTSTVGTVLGARSNAITEKCHCRIGMTNLGNTLSSSRMILSTSTANMSGYESKKHSLV